MHDYDDYDVIFFIFYFVCMNVGLCVIMYHEHAGQYLRRTEEGARSA